MPYAAQTTYKGEAYDVAVRFTERAADVMAQRYLWADLERCVFGQGDGEHITPIPIGAEYEALTGKRVPFLCMNEHGAFGVPTEVIIDASPTASGVSYHIKFEGLRFPGMHPYTPDHDFVIPREDQDVTPLTWEQWPHTVQQVDEHLSIHAATPELCARARVLWTASSAPTTPRTPACTRTPSGRRR